MSELSYRQIHLDFHTSPDAKGIGTDFKAEEFKESLKKGHISSMTLFAVGHHGWSYNKTEVGQMHPHLDFDLLRAQYDACLEVGVEVCPYLTGGVNNRIWDKHPEWREINDIYHSADMDEKELVPHFKNLCFNTGYLDYLCELIKETALLFPKSSGIFIDIIRQTCSCDVCSNEMKKRGMDPENNEERDRYGMEVLNKYYSKTYEALKSVDKDMRLFHNSGHISRGRRDILKYFSHLELESLPTGGWGYDHFPMSAKYAHLLGLDFLGMTGKFHTTWGEMGGFKHPNALIYECSAMIAHGAKCSIGDHPQPEAKLDPKTYESIGKAYKHVEECEPWCTDSKQVSDIAILSGEALGIGGKGRGRANVPDTGASRALLEEHILFDLIDLEVDFNNYKMIILPDCIPVDSELKKRLDSYLQQGGKLYLTGESGRDSEGNLLFDAGCEYAGDCDYKLDYLMPLDKYCPDFVDMPLVMYSPADKFNLTDGESLGDIYYPLFDRTKEHFSGHQHAPSRPESSGFHCGSRKGNVMYIAHPVFKIYYALGAVAYRQYIAKTIREFIGSDNLSVETDLPSTARITLTKQSAQNRYAAHLLYAPTIKRGGEMELSGGTMAGKIDVEIIEDLLPLCNIKLGINVPEQVKSVKLQPQGTEVEFTKTKNGCEINIDSFTCHQIVEINCN